MTLDSRQAWQQSRFRVLGAFYTEEELASASYYKDWSAYRNAVAKGGKENEELEDLTNAEAHQYEPEMRRSVDFRWTKMSLRASGLKARYRRRLGASVSIARLGIRRETLKSYLEVYCSHFVRPCIMKAIPRESSESQNTQCLSMRDHVNVATHVSHSRNKSRRFSGCSSSRKFMATMLQAFSFIVPK